MARIPEAEIERIKCEVSVQRLVEASGITNPRALRTTHVISGAPGLL